MSDEDPRVEWPYPVATNTPDEIRSGVDASAYNPPAEDDPRADHEPAED